MTRTFSFKIKFKYEGVAFTNILSNYKKIYNYINYTLNTELVLNIHQPYCTSVSLSFILHFFTLSKTAF